MSTLSQLKHDIYYESKCKRVNYSIQNGRGRDNILSQSHGSGHFNVPGFWYRQNTKDRPSTTTTSHENEDNNDNDYDSNCNDK